ncbi:insulinase family protein [Pseudoalteromonas piscicida]|uniref:Insulinase family protein n=1 Tax=Pseudoalteromonas piscicida TaxID=43662 RepID=A0AAD0W732_PSEO7|nr:insulinase family protein [Pseudoalteromonas piscicida]ASD69005.1 hypothetical protein B1L02_18935 [Pseudoalteromonas piscicida]AXR04623.1 insulinase family protein [Pseudoalteromonas piscicida]
MKAEVKLMNFTLLSLAISASLLTLSGCSTSNTNISPPFRMPTSAPSEKPNQPFYVEFEKFTLANGLEVIFHIDRSAPVVAVTLAAHVGSAREKVGKTGFAHLFEHLLFLESEN